MSTSPLRSEISPVMAVVVIVVVVVIAVGIGWMMLGRVDRPVSDKPARPPQLPAHIPPPPRPGPVAVPSATGR
jgi:hypothetical protein